MKNLALKIFLLFLALLFLSMIAFCLMAYFVFIPFDIASNPAHPPALGKSLCKFILILLTGVEYFTVKKLIALFNPQKPRVSTTLKPYYPKSYSPPILQVMSPLENLVGLLHSVACYNDKGYIWQNDSPEKSEGFRKQWGKERDDLISEIGEEKFPAELLNKLKSTEAIEDWSGRFAEELERWVAQNKES